MKEKVLVVGGTGPTGRYIIDGLRERGHEVTIFHRGNHELPELADLEHIHGDPHFSDTIEAALGDRTFDTVMGMYGRTALVAEHFAKRETCRRFIGIGSNLGYRGWVEPSSSVPSGPAVLCREDTPQVDDAAVAQWPNLKFARKIVATEQSVFAHHRPGTFEVTWLRYSVIYGPGNVIPWEWSVLKRVRDQRPFMMIPSDGMEIRSRLYARNAAHAVLLAFDKPDVSAGEVYNCADDHQYTQRQWIDLVQQACGGTMELVSLPWEIAEPAWFLLPSHIESVAHGLVDTSKIRTQLGYRDAVPAPEAIRETVRFYERRPVTPEEFPNLQDRFQYDMEDRLLAAYRCMIERLREQRGIGAREKFHPYPHPREIAGVRADAKGR